MNAYYGVYLLGLARKDANLADWGRTLMATEVSVAKRYYHIASTDVPQIYPKPFAANKVVGVLWSGMVRFRGQGLGMRQCLGTRTAPILSLR